VCDYDFGGALEFIISILNEQKWTCKGRVVENFAAVVLLVCFELLN